MTEEKPSGLEDRTSDSYDYSSSEGITNQGYARYRGNFEIRTKDWIIISAVLFGSLWALKHFVVDPADIASQERWRKAHAPVYRNYTPDPRSIPTIPSGEWNSKPAQEDK